MAPSSTAAQILGWNADGAEIRIEGGIAWMLTLCCGAAVTGSYVIDEDGSERATSVCKACGREAIEDTDLAVEATVWDQPGALEAEAPTPAEWLARVPRRHRDGLVVLA